MKFMNVMFMASRTKRDQKNGEKENIINDVQWKKIYTCSEKSYQMPHGLKVQFYVKNVVIALVPQQPVKDNILESSLNRWSCIDSAI